LGKRHMGVIKNSLAGTCQSNQTDTGIPLCFFLADQAGFLHGGQHAGDAGRTQSYFVGQINSPHFFIGCQVELPQHKILSHTDAVTGKWARQAFMNVGIEVDQTNQQFANCQVLHGYILAMYLSAQVSAEMLESSSSLFWRKDVRLEQQVFTRLVQHLVVRTEVLHLPE
jgi:hypothetical protein